MRVLPHTVMLRKFAGKRHMGQRRTLKLVIVGLFTVSVIATLDRTSMLAEQNSASKPTFFDRFKIKAPRMPWSKKQEVVSADHEQAAAKTSGKRVIEPVGIWRSKPEPAAQPTPPQVQAFQSPSQRFADQFQPPPRESSNSPQTRPLPRPQSTANPTSQFETPINRWPTNTTIPAEPNPFASTSDRPTEVSPPNSWSNRTTLQPAQQVPYGSIRSGQMHSNGSQVRVPHQFVQDRNWRQASHHNSNIRLTQNAKTRPAPGVQEPLADPGNPDVEDVNPPKPIPRTLRVPIDGSDDRGQIDVNNQGGKIWLVVRNAPVGDVLGVLAQQQGLNIVTPQEVSTRISVTLSSVTFEDALNGILAVAGYTWVRQNNIILVTKIIKGGTIAPNTQGRMLQVFELQFVTAIEIGKVVSGLLSPVGNSFTSETDPANNRRSKELLVVEDLPAYVERIAGYIQQVDQPPKQVLIEAHILQVDLKDEAAHGIDWTAVARVAGSRVSFGAAGFAKNATDLLANPGFKPATPTSSFTINGTDLNVVLEALKTTNDAKTLAKPRVLATNGQESSISIGREFGYLGATQTATNGSTQQSVEFLKTGVRLKVTPYITAAGSVLMTVDPEVSNGFINEGGFPVKDSTESHSTALLQNGQGMVIGGLINETDSETQNKVPLLGDLWLVGRMFQRRSMNKSRSEIIIVLIPRVVPYGVEQTQKEQVELARAETPLFHGALKRTNRPWEPKLEDAMHNPREVRLDRFPHFWRNLWAPFPHPLEYYMPTVADENPWLVEAHQTHNCFPPVWLETTEIEQPVPAAPRTSWYEEEVPEAPATSKF